MFICLTFFIILLLLGLCECMCMHTCVRALYMYNNLSGSVSSVCSATEVSCDADPNFLYNVCDLSPCPDSHVCNRELAHTYSSTQLLSLWSCMRIVKPSRSFSYCAENVSISTEGLCCPFGYTGPTCEGTTCIIMLWHHQLQIQYWCYFYVPCLFL